MIMLAQEQTDTNQTPQLELQNTLKQWDRSKKPNYLFL